MFETIDVVALFAHAGLVVKGVVVLLLVLSVWCWGIIASAAVGLWQLRRILLTSGEPSALAGSLGLWARGRAEAEIVHAGETLAERRIRVAGAIRRRAQEDIERAQGGLVNLAVIASVAPFVGLFGTVWGIMTSFMGIAAAKDTSLAVVAPGIAEALAATAIGLVAAIPAAFAYNRLAAAFGRTGRALNRLIEANVPEMARPIEPQASPAVSVLREVRR